MTDAFTPGPWTTSGQKENFGGDVFVYGRDRRAIARVYSPFAEDRTRPATAALIAAAPDLYEALSELVEVRRIKGIGGGAAQAEYLQRREPAWQKARAALAKATGKPE